MEQQVLHRIIERAARAPSVHNTQPWRFVSSGNELQLWTEPSRGLAVLDPTGRARHISCGAALLHARVAAADAGCRADVTTLPDPSEPEHLADVRLTETPDPDPRDRVLAGAIDARRTAREAFSAEPLPGDVVAAVRAAAESEGCWLRVVDRSEDATALAVLMARADEVEHADPAYRDELRRWTEGADQSAEGVPSTAVPETAPAERGSSFRLRDFVADRDNADAAAPADPPPAEHPLVVVLGTRYDSVSDWIAAGQATGRLLLTAAAHGVAASPMTQPLEIPDTRARLATDLGVVGHPQMIFRLGYPGDAATGPATPRRPVEEVLTETDE